MIDMAKPDLCAINQDDILHIGFDDTDSICGKCTTHLAFKITGYLLKNSDTEFLDYPLLVRLNPNIPLKTRGNGAVCLRVKVRNHEKIIQDITQLIEEESATGLGANPGVAFFNGGLVPKALKEFGRFAMFDILSKQKAEKIAKENRVRHFTFGNGRGFSQLFFHARRHSRTRTLIWSPGLRAWFRACGRDQRCLVASILWG